MESVAATAGTKDLESDWPRQIEDDYERMRPLGEGAFGVVWLAKAKDDRREEDMTRDDDARFDAVEWTDGDPPSPPSPAYVAIKQIVAANDKARRYAEREIAILSEVDHPNIVRCLRHVEMPRSILVVMTLADGPDLGDLVRVGGALSVSLARLAARCLISAVAYLHGRGVIHRDIKPDNCILVAKKATTSTHHDQSTRDDWMSNDAFWDDKAAFDDSEWTIVLVDFGFAKALTPAECGVENNNGRSRRPSVMTLIKGNIEKQASDERKDKGMHDSVENGSGIAASSSRKRKSILFKSLNSFERMPIRAMSSLGTRDFAAPEVTNSREKSHGDTALSENVADYGLNSDSYSIGCTIRVMLTGIPANEKNEMDFMSSRDGVLSLYALFSCCSKKRNVRYKWLDESPKGARELVLKMTNPVYADRLSVHLAREELWIKGGMTSNDPVISLPTGDIPGRIDDPIKFLKCATLAAS
ncbi:hypothetical protein ACHAW5_001164 [Stephanodiscus triporus]|uniref:Protein kinase domain-containing protein n=1 Tax=Stephanodiscus triporus TaxID=2934178 RepID=A0ABD3MR85_9STRA